MNTHFKAFLVLSGALLFVVAYGLSCSSDGCDDDDDDDDVDGDDDDDDIDDDDDDDDDDLVPDGFVLLSNGEFQMGSPEGEPGRSNDELPHSVTLTSPFIIAILETTQAEFEDLLGFNPSHFTNCGADCPVEQISWFDALAYSNKLSASESLTECYLLTDIVCNDDTAGNAADYCKDNGGIKSAGVALNGVATLYECVGYRLPSEAEWEYAIRAGSSSAFYNGEITQTGCSPLDPNLDLIGWFCGNASSTLHMGGGKLANAWGLFDMSGNVWEWTNDYYDIYPSEALSDPEGPLSGSNRVSRGGGFANEAYYSRSAKRLSRAPGSRYIDLGFRVARTWTP